MSRIFTVLALLIMITAPAGSATILVGDSAAEMERTAAVELQKYLYAASGELLPIAHSAEGDVIVVGTPKSNPLIRRLGLQLADLGDEGYLLRTVRHGNGKALVVTGNTPTAVQFGVYALLEEYGFGFYLGGDAVPIKRAFRLLDLDISRTPVFGIRGTLPWYNFFNSPTAWDYDDYVWFFDNLVKAGNNFIGFHSYDFEPFAAYEEDGRFIWGEPLASTDTPTWGTRPMKTSEFGFGTDRYFGDEYFGSKTSLYRQDRERSIRDAQEVLRKSLDYAKSRGLKTCLGFEVGEPDPTDPQAVERLEKRLKALVATYPMLDYVWIWEPEALGHGRDTQPLDSNFGAYYRRWEKDFAYLGDPRRITEAVRMTIYTLEAHRILKEAAPSIRLVVSGWGGDNWLHCTDFYPGMDALVPKEIIFAALDNIRVSDTVSEAYGKLSPDRERWPIPWFEWDGDQWFPQPGANIWLNAFRDALEKGSRGILGIHWRTRDVEESHAIMSQFAWNTDLTYDEFYERYARRCFGETYARPMAKILKELQSLDYRWIGGTGQQECGGFGWGLPTDPERARRLEGLLRRMEFIHGRMASRPELAAQTDRLHYLISTAEWVLRYEDTARTLRQGGEVEGILHRARELSARGDKAEAAELASEGLEKLADCRFELALDACARRVTNKGELGILATVNTKAWAAYRVVERELMDLGGKKAPPMNKPETSGSSLIQPINPNTLWFSGTPLPVKTITHRDGCSVRMIYRQAGDKSQRTITLRKEAERCFRGEIRCPKRFGTVIEYALELLDAQGQVIDRWPGEDLMHQVALRRPAPETKPSPVSKLVPAPISNLTAMPGDGALVLEWEASVGRYEIHKAEDDGEAKLIHATSDTWFEDRDVEPDQTYRYSVMPPGSPELAVHATVKAPDASELPVPSLTATAGPEKVRLNWGKADLGTSGFLIYAAADPAGPWKCLNSEAPMPPNNWRGHVFVAKAEPGEQTHYKVVVLDRRGKEARQSAVVSSAALPTEPPRLVLAVDFQGELDSGSWGRYPAVEPVNGVPAARFIEGNYAAFPHRPEFNPDCELSIDMWAKLESPGVMPVLLCHGHYGHDGYFVQVLHGRLRFYLHGVGVLDVGRVSAGEWHHIAATYDGYEMVVYLNGQVAGRQIANGRVTPNGRYLYIGRYELPGQDWETDCQIAEVRLYSTALPEEAVMESYAGLAGKLRK